MKKIINKFTFIPSRLQWRKWSLPTKIGYIAAWVTIISFCYMVFLELFKDKSHINNKDDKSAILIDPSAFNRPKDLSPQSFYLHSNLFRFIRGYPFDLYLGLDLKEFEIRYSGFIDKKPSPIEGFQVYGLKKSPLTEQRDTGRFNLAETFFLFESDKLVFIKLGMIFPPEEEQNLYGTLDKLHPNYKGKRYYPGNEFIWVSEEGLHQELLYLFHGYGSGVNYFTLFQVTFPLNDLQLKLQNVDIKIDSQYEAFQRILSTIVEILESELFTNDFFSKLELAPVVREYAIRKINSLF